MRLRSGCTSTSPRLKWRTLARRLLRRGNQRRTAPVQRTDSHLVLFVGSLFTRRHIPALIDGFAKLSRQRPARDAGDRRRQPHDTSRRFSGACLLQAEPPTASRSGLTLPRRRCTACTAAHEHSYSSRNTRDSASLPSRRSPPASRSSCSTPLWPARCIRMRPSMCRVPIRRWSTLLSSGRCLTMRNVRGYLEASARVLPRYSWQRVRRTGARSVVSDRRTGMTPLLSIVIVTYNSSRHIDACLESAATTLPPLDYETVVVDNASPDGTAQRRSTTVACGARDRCGGERRLRPRHKYRHPAVVRRVCTRR